jgi:predicted mannosyl-3-phosphoglycerate phosphatase (HAD superfamily)
MADVCGDLVGEIRYSSDLTFEEVGELEVSLQERLECVLADFNPVYLEVRTTGDELVFVSSLTVCQVEELREVCRVLGELLGPGAKGRMVFVEHRFGPVTGWIFTALGYDETEVFGQI